LVGILPLSSTPLLFIVLTYLAVPTDVSVFVIVLVQAQTIKSRHQGNGSRILDTVTRDAEIYFAVITTSHLLIVVMILTARVRFSVPVPEFDAC
jgi:hypothetical protein